MTMIADIIKYDSRDKAFRKFRTTEEDGNPFVWKHPREDFNTYSQLIVHESQEAVFFMNGQALKLFGPGRYTLDTESLPLATRVLNRTTGGRTPFHCEVYFVNKTEQMAIRWGTLGKILFMEPCYGFPVSIGASGEMSLRVADSRKLLLKLVGTSVMLSRQELTNYFRAFLMERVKSYIAQVIKAKSISVFELDENLALFSGEIQKLLIPDFADYGISLERFFITTVVPPEEEAYKNLKELRYRQYAEVEETRLRQQTDLIAAETEAQRTVIASKAQMARREQEGFTYQQERGFDVAQDAVRNEAVGQYSNLGIGLGTAAGVGGTVGGLITGAMDGALKPTAGADGLFCDHCGAKLGAEAVFCDQCGTEIKGAIGTCRSCGFPFTRAGQFCPKCGAKREE